ncbi:MAG: ROK family glucokinase [Eubacterium sp.]|nr:ROK family glucokinase [Eubacterium sp.]
MANFYVGVDVGGTTIKMGIFSDAGELLEKWEIPTRTEDDGVNILPDIVDSIEAKRAERDGNILGIGMGIPGPMTEEGVVLRCANFGWGVFSVKNTVADMTGIGNVRVGNDANVAALGEIWKGGGRGHDSIVMVTLGTGVGGGIIQNGKVLTGSTGAGGEIGHIKVEFNNPVTCGCGNKGCLEQYASATGIVRMANEGLKDDSTLAAIAKTRDITAKDVFDEAKAGDAYAREIVERFGRYLGIALSNVAHVVDPEAFVIGGGVSAAGGIITDVVEKYYNENAMYALKNKEFHLAELGNDAGIYGAVRMVLFQ